MTQTVLGIIGGSGFYEMPGMQNAEWRHIESPWGRPSDDVLFAEIDGLITPVRAPYSTHVFHQYTLKVLDGKRDALIAHLQQQEIPAMIYYPVPLQEQQAFKEICRVNGSLEVTNLLCQQVMSLPIHSELDAATQDRIIDAVRSFFTA